VQQKIAYKSFQTGGEVPLHGFRKHAPEKPKGKHLKAACNNHNQSERNKNPLISHTTKQKKTHVHCTSDRKTH
jgi:hypothetical protein